MKRSGFVLGAMILLVVMAFAAPLLAGDLNPPGAPAPTMKTLDQIPPTWSMKIPCDTAQNCPRFVVLTDFNSDAVLDKETGLVWEKSPGTTVHTWQDAQFQCFGRYWGGRGGWGPPRMEELSSILTFLPVGHPFANVDTASADFYWSTTSLAGDNTQAWALKASTQKGWRLKTESHLVWCVRGGHGHDGK